jgi:hypothetical protein
MNSLFYLFHNILCFSPSLKYHVLIVWNQFIRYSIYFFLIKFFMKPIFLQIYPRLMKRLNRNIMLTFKQTYLSLTKFYHLLEYWNICFNQLFWYAHQKFLKLIFRYSSSNSIYRLIINLYITYLSYKFIISKNQAILWLHSLSIFSILYQKVFKV